MTSCHTLGRRRSTPASWNAAIGETRAARLEARQVPSSATATPLGAAIAHASHGAGLARSTAQDAAPLEQRPGRPAPPPLPAGNRPQPRATATTADSPSTIRRTCRGVAPTSRSRPSWRRREATTKPKVLPTTNTAMNSETRRHDPEQAGQVGELRPVLGGQPGRVTGALDRRADVDRDREQRDAEGEGHEGADVRRPRVPDRLPAEPHHHRSSSLIVAAIVAASARSSRPTT